MKDCAFYILLFTSAGKEANAFPLIEEYCQCHQEKLKSNTSLGDGKLNPSEIQINFQSYCSTIASELKKQALAHAKPTQVSNPRLSHQGPEHWISFHPPSSAGIYLEKNNQLLPPSQSQTGAAPGCGALLNGYASAQAPESCCHLP